MAIRSISPLDGATLSVHETWTTLKLRERLAEQAAVERDWVNMPLKLRCQLVTRLGAVLRADSSELARLVTLETGKLAGEATDEVAHCAALCDQFAFTARQRLASGGEGAVEVRHMPIGTVLLMTPAHSPLSLVFRVAIPALLAGNGVLLRHASQVPQCALAIERLMQEALGSSNPFRTLLISHEQVGEVIGLHSLGAVSFTGSEAVGRQIAGLAGLAGRKSMLHLGASDPFVVLDDADLDAALPAALESRFANAGQRALGAKRFIVTEGIADRFVAALQQRVEREMRHGDPSDPATRLAPMVTHAARDALHQQVFQCRSLGARVVTGCMPGEGPGAFYQASVLDHVVAGMPAYERELYGPVAAVLRARDERHAIELANDTRFALGASVWSADPVRARAVARRLRCTLAFVNRVPRVTPDLTHGGLADSGYGSLLGDAGIGEFSVTRTELG